ncbi:MAG: hypothetical protein V7786_02005 [Sulfitobacter litoralis]|uniref:hypothetical protein n=1 Tax=Sulfitobacter litoralis TaxID=335975 RepID=UPI0030024BC2
MGFNQSKAEDRRFKEYVTETAFSLSLTKAMVSELGLIGSQGPRGNGGHTVNALYRRGLIIPDKEDWAGFANWELSAAGEAVVELLIVAGLVKSEQKPLAEAA